MAGRSAPTALLARASRETESLDKPIFADVIFEVLNLIAVDSGLRFLSWL